MRTTLLRLSFEFSLGWKVSLAACISDMASDWDSDVTKLKGTKITVTVEDALCDVIVVTFHVGSKIFQGALLDVTKKNSPYGIVPPLPPPKEENSTVENTDGQDEKTDKLHSLKQRHTYYQIPAGTTHFFIGRYARTAKDKSVRMRRLRPRKVLCSHCQEICNDTDSNPKKGGTATRTKAVPARTDRSSHPTSGKIAISDGNRSSRVLTRSSRSESSDKKSDCTTEEDTTVIVKAESKEDVECNGFATRAKLLPKAEKMVLRKRKMSFPENLNPTVSLEKQRRVSAIKSDDEGFTSPSAPSNSGVVSVKSSLAKTSPVIKISFANPQGKDTVLKIPPRVQITSDTEEEPNWLLPDKIAEKSASAKAAKKALKKAKKEAQKKATNIASTASNQLENGDAADGGDKDRRHHHKHKVKKKRKHKTEEEGDKFNSENTDTRNVFNTSGNDGWCLRTNFGGDLSLVTPDLSSKPTSVFDDVKNKCLHQKLSISLKRLSTKAYMKCSPKYSVEEDPLISDISDASSVSVGSGDGEDYGDVPDFPKHSSPLRDIDKVKPLMVRISTHNVKKCMLDMGREMAVGDIVWGKIHGFPWWPGKVLALTLSQRDNGATVNQQAHVSWFGSSTSSYMPCNQLSPFLDDFKLRYNKKKRGPYKEAIRQAWHEANVPGEELQDINLVTA